LKVQKEQLTIQLDHERNQEGDQEDADRDEEEEASSEVSFRQTWPPAAPTSQKKDEKEPPKRQPGTPSTSAASGLFGGTSHPSSGRPARAPASTGTTGASVQGAKKRKEADKVNIPPLPKAPQFRSWKLAVRDEIASASGDPD